jgi:hypothetical protein
MPPQDTVNGQQPHVPVPAAPPQKIGKFKGSIRIVKESWAILRQDKEILWFPVLSLVVSIIAFGIFCLALFFVVFGGDFAALQEWGESSFGVIDAVIFVVYYTLMYFIVNFFQAGIYIIAHGRMQGRNLTFQDGIRGAQEVIGKIFVWSLISATVGVILRTLAERSKLLGRIVVMILGAAWGILTYFSLPSLVIGRASVIDSFKMSADTIRKTWGETIIVNLGVGLIFGLITFVGLIVGVIVILVMPVVYVVIPIILLMFVFVLGVSIVANALGAIFKLALFEYARTGVVPQGFSADIIQSAISSKKK